MHLGFLGLGLIGGSIARAALRSGFATRVSAWTPAGTGPAAARRDGIEVARSAAEAVRGASLVVLAAPPLDCLALLDELAGPLGRELAADVVVTDVASTKTAIVDRAGRLGLRFVGGHPMAGRETTGYASADPDLLRDRPWVVVPTAEVDDDAVARVEMLAAACGARPMRMVADEHDRAVAAVSHLPLLVSAALAESVTAAPDWPAARALASTGWAGMTRLALGDPAMAAGIVGTNGAAIADRLDAFRVVLDEWAATLRADAGVVDAEARFAAARGRLAEGGETGR